MEITTDILLKGQVWSVVIDKLSNIFVKENRTNYSIYILCTAIGIMYDQRITNFEDFDENPRNVPRTVLQNHDNGKLDFMFQAAILSTQTEDFSEEKRLELAFGDKNDQDKFKKIEFLTQFANFGVTKLAELVEDDDIETMENIKNFLNSSIEGNNYDIDGISDDILLEEY